jgi:hypothetical protein
VTACVLLLGRAKTLYDDLISARLIVMPLLTAGVLFAMGIIVVVLTGVTALHLLWWYFASNLIAVFAHPLFNRLWHPLLAAVLNAKRRGKSRFAIK